MKFVIAMDSFKGGLPAPDVCRAVEAGIHDVMPEAVCLLVPMADGGEGTAAALLTARPGGHWIPRTVAGPLPERPVNAGFAWFPDDRTAIVEMAAANGLPLLKPHERNPLATGTYGTGQLIKAAVEYGARRILLAVGGSATVDGGIGAAAALGWQFLDANGRPLPPVGGHLQAITGIIPPDDRSLPPVTVLCDVTNPLYGPRGAAVVFGPQKGATPDMVQQLDTGLKHLATCLYAQLGIDLSDLPGGGAAGGLAAGAVAFFHATMAPGIATIIDAAGLHIALTGADWCVTGEGSFDDQSLDGKVVSGVAAAARAAAVKTVVIAGRVRVDPGSCRTHGIHAAFATHAPDMPMETVIQREPELIRTTAGHWARTLVDEPAPRS